MLRVLAFGVADSFNGVGASHGVANTVCRFTKAF